ncbi:helix-turn-helix transcriptional regulator [Planomicrobium sp. YIM 101495]|uniref:helix-turn-helix transcriptional regulator n=1 Tax=Planomicrobium sp. YIM 101495 TaxID=2665160 RepID=UPI0012B86BE8|nr:helix-turn-helix transcriptional regulator [Planomicrobium sp. YIM 101495]MTD30193.1 helix-turn-helix domain-containing protein [Planomicrobium sp. YIM 101495]
MTGKEVVNLELIKELRIERGLSIEEMSKLLGYEGYQAYYYKEKGIRKMSAEDIAKIAYVLKTPIKKLFFEEIITEKVTKEKKKSAV